MIAQVLGLIALTGIGLWLGRRAQEPHSPSLSAIEQWTADLRAETERVRAATERLRAENDRLRAELARAGVETRP